MSQSQFVAIYLSEDIVPGGGYSHILDIRVCAAGEGMVFKPFGLLKGMVFKPFGLV